MLSQIQSHLQAIHRINAPDIAPFLLNAEALTELLGPGSRTVDEWVLVREADDGLDLGVYISAERLSELSSVATPGEAVERCFGAFCAATEGVSHFLMLIERARRREPVRLLELELQAEVDKFVSAWLHHRGDWRQLGRRLFRDAVLREGLSEPERWRYREAGRLAEGLCRWLVDQGDVAAVLREVRRLWRLPGSLRLSEARQRVAEGLTF
ncbi:MAG: hypothetical protein ACI8S6_004472 [Myxococcota bacterium]|jgi:hypothetical protein